MNNAGREEVGREAEIYKKLDNDKVMCLACRHYCIIKEGMTGICGIRANIKGRLYLLAHSFPSAIHLDPIEKKPFYHFLPSSLSLSVGTLGCNFRCSWCQNHELSQSIKERAGFSSRVAINIIKKEAEYIEPEKIVEMAKQLGAQSITYTYNEPTIWVEYAKEIAKLAKKEGIRNVFVSSGYESHEVLDYIKEIDAFNIDLKAFKDETYRKHIGGVLEGVLDTIESIIKRRKWVEITTLIIPTINDSDKELRDIASFIFHLSPTIPWHISRFFPHYKLKDLPPTPLKTLERAREIGKQEGLKYVYIGNVINEKYESTYCPRCGSKVIVRRGYEVIDLTDNGKCRICGYKIEGRWK